MTKLFEELSESEIRELRSKVVSYDPEVFEKALAGVAGEIEMYKSLGPEFKREHREAVKQYEALMQINNWIKEYNCKNEYHPDRVDRVSNCIRVKTYFDPVYLRECNFTDYIAFSGMFTVADLYIIPVKFLGINPDRIGDKATAHCINKELNRVVKEMYEHPENIHDQVPSMEDANYGTMRLISRTHCAVVARKQDNPIAAHYIRHTLNWNFIHKDGSSC